MKRHEKMGINLNTVEGLLKVSELECKKDMPCYETCEQYFKNLECKNNAVCRAKHLLAEVPTKKVKRWETYNGDFVKAGKEHLEIICEGSPSCAHTCEECFAKWLMEDVEVEV